MIYFLKNKFFYILDLFYVSEYYNKLDIDEINIIKNQLINYSLHNLKNENIKNIFNNINFIIGYDLESIKFIFKNIYNFFSEINLLNCFKINNYINKLNYNKKYTNYFNSFLVNCLFKKISNSVIIPLGIIKKPFFNLNYSKLRNFTSIGFFISHEIFHSIDFYSNIEKNNDIINIYYSYVDFLDKLYNIKNIGIIKHCEFFCDLNALNVISNIIFNIFNKSIKVKMFIIYYICKIFRIIYNEKEYNKLLFDSNYLPHNDRVKIIISCLSFFDNTIKLKNENIKSLRNNIILI